MQILETPRLTLRYITVRDADAFVPILGDALVMRYSVIGVHTPKQIRQFIDQRLISYLERGFGLYALVHKQDEKMIGYCGFFYPINRRKSGSGSRLSSGTEILGSRIGN